MSNRLSLAVDTAEAARRLHDADDAVEDGATDTVKQLTILAEAAMKDEAAEGAGRDQHLRDSVDTKFRNGGMVGNVGPRKRTEQGWLLASVVVQGTDPSSYDPENPPPPMFDWAAAKLGDESLGWAVAQSIAQDGHRTFPNPFVSRSLKTWRSQVGDVASDEIADALSRLMGGA